MVLNFLLPILSVSNHAVTSSNEGNMILPFLFRWPHHILKLLVVLNIDFVFLKDKISEKKSLKNLKFSLNVWSRFKKGDVSFIHKTF